MITAEIVTIGDELLIGQVVDTNSAFIGERFCEAGVPVVRINSIGDRHGEIVEQIGASLSRAEVVVITGGLGPTKDDITKKAIAEFLGVGMHRDQATYENVKRMVARRGIAFNEGNQAQADVPDGCEILTNEHGSAPGMMFLVGGRLLFSLPGVPFEMKALLTEKVLPAIVREFSLHSVVHKTVITYGLPESILSERLEAWETALPSWLRLAYLPNPRAIRLRLSAYDVEKAKADSEIEMRLRELRSVLGPHYLGDELASLEGCVSDILRERGRTLAVAESCTGGRVSARLTALAGASDYYIGGVTSYSNSVKMSVLGVSQSDLEAHGAVSQQVAEAMAVGVRERLGADYGIATTGVAGPGGGSDEKPVGTVWIAAAGEWGVRSVKLQLGLLREQNIERASSEVLDMLRLLLLGVDVDGASSRAATYL